MLPKYFASILWEYDLNKINYYSDTVFIRSLTIGDKEHSDYLKNKLWIEIFKKKFLQNIDKLDKKTINYWGIIFDINVKKYLNKNQDTYEKLNDPIFTRNFG